MGKKRSFYIEDLPLWPAKAARKKLRALHNYMRAEHQIRGRAKRLRAMRKWARANALLDIRYKAPFWKCKDGRLYRMSELKTGHLVNIYRYLRRHGNVTYAEWRGMARYIQHAPDAAADAADYEFQRSVPSRRLEWVIEEIIRRKLVV